MEDPVQVMKVARPTGVGGLMVSTGTEVGGVGVEGEVLIANEGEHVEDAEGIFILNQIQLRRMPKTQKEKTDPI